MHDANLFMCCDDSLGKSRVHADKARGNASFEVFSMFPSRGLYVAAEVYGLLRGGACSALTSFAPCHEPWVLRKYL